MATFIWILGPQAVGKMTVGRELANQLDYKFFHGHQSIELALLYFEYGSPGFREINSTIRKVIFEQVSQNEEIGFVFTYLPSFNLPEQESEYMRNINHIFTSSILHWDIKYVELYSDLDVRLIRNKHPDRIAEKPSKSDVELSERRIINFNSMYHGNSSIEFPFFLDEVAESDYLKINNSKISPQETAERIIHHYQLKDRALTWSRSSIQMQLI